MDWQDTGECHENDGVHRTSGRIYKVTFGDQRQSFQPLHKLSNEDLVRLLSKDRWHFEQASLLLRTRMARGLSSEKIVSLASQSKSPNASLFRNMMSGDLGASAVFGTANYQALAEYLMAQTSDKLPESRIREFLQVWNNDQALRHAERSSITLPAAFFPKMAAKVSPRLRQIIASSLSRLSPEIRFRTAHELLKFAEDDLA